MKKARATLTLLLLAAVLSACASSKGTPAVGPYITISDKIVKVEVAKTEAQRTQGLSNHQPLGDNYGMLFVFDDAKPRSFWMKEMGFPIDIIWIKDSTVIKISPDLPPEGENPAHIYESGEPANYVLEVAAGWAKKNQITPGDKLSYHYD